MEIIFPSLGWLISSCGFVGFGFLPCLPLLDTELSSSSSSSLRVFLWQYIWSGSIICRWWMWMRVHNHLSFMDFPLALF